MVYFANNAVVPGSAAAPSRRALSAAVIALFFAVALSGCDLSANHSLVEERAGFKTRLLSKEKYSAELPAPPFGMFELVEYEAPVGRLPAYVGVPQEPNKRLPAIIWLSGGFSNSIDESAWTPGPDYNDQSARAFREAGIIMMYPALRGGNNGPGFLEGFYGEVDDVMAARDFLARQPFVDPEYIYLGGHSTGATLALLVAASTDKFRSVLALGPVGMADGYGDEYFHFDVDDDREWVLRSPLFYLDTITSPTTIIEGTEGNIESLRLMNYLADNERLQFIELEGRDHFEIVRPITMVMAQKIVAEFSAGTVYALEDSGADSASVR